MTPSIVPSNRPLQLDHDAMVGISISPRAGILISAAFCGLILSKGLALVPGFAMDDYVILHVDRLPLFSIGQGRFTQAVLQSLLTYIGTSATSLAFASSLMFFFGGALAITTGILYATRRRGPVAVHAACAAMIGAHPYITEYFTFRESLITQSVSFLLLGLAFVMVLRVEATGPGPFGFLRCGAITACLVAVAGAQQTAFLVAIFFVMTRLAIDWSQGKDVGSWRNVLRANASMIAVIGWSVVLYTLIYFLTRRLGGVIVDDRTSVIGFGDLGNRIPKVIDLMATALLWREPVLSEAVKQLMLFTLIGFSIVAGWRRPRSAISAVVLFCLFFAFSFLLLSVSKIWWPVPRATYGVAFAFGLAFVALSMQLRTTVHAMSGMCAAAALGLCFHSSAILHDQWRLNRWDAWTASTIAQQLLMRGYQPSQQIVLVGAPWYFPAGLKTIEGDLNVSALSASWAASDLMRETTGRAWFVRSEPPGSKACVDSTTWPSPNAIHEAGNEVYVCMGR